MEIINTVFRQLSASDYNSVISLWKNTEGMSIGSADSPEGYVRFIERNPGLSWCVELNGAVSGSVLAGHDGRRGYIYHLAVAKELRNRGIGKKLLNCAINSLEKENIDKVHIFVFRNNEPGISFWNATGWLKRDDIYVYSREKK